MIENWGYQKILQTFSVGTLRMTKAGTSTLGYQYTIGSEQKIASVITYMYT